MSFWTFCLILFLIIDPLGKIGAFLRVLEHVPPKRQPFVIGRELLIALGLMVVFNFIGEWIFSFLELSSPAVHLSAGIILFLTALRILFPKIREIEPKRLEGEPFLVPLAVPLVASPALLATVMLFARLEPVWQTSVLAIFVAWAAAGLILLSSRPLYHFLGKSGLLGIERLMGMVLVMLAVQRLVEGLHLFVGTF